MKKKTDGFSIKMKKDFSVEKDTTEEGLSIVSRLLICAHSFDLHNPVYELSFTDKEAEAQRS